MKIDRRKFIKNSALAMFSSGVLNVSAQNEVKEVAKLGKAKAVIQIWLWGGPSHNDTFDPKPEAGNDYCGSFTNTIATKTDGLIFNGRLEELAKISDKFSIIRSMKHSTNAHETASYLVQTGRMPSKDVYPAIGAVVAKFKAFDVGYNNVIPPYIVLTEPQGRFSEAGFLGAKYKPFATGGDPSASRFLVEGIIAQGITPEAQTDRRKLLENLNIYKKALKANPSLAKANMSVEQAYDLILGDAGKIFDLSLEDAKLRDSYGRSKLGQSCLMARKLVESGVVYITINAKGWDTHRLHFQEMGRMLPSLDKAVATLIKDLDERGLLDSTIVMLGGEFGRTPKIDWQAPFNGGRGHWGHAFSYLLAGGGIKGGTFVGKTDERGEHVVERPIHPANMIATLYNRLGIDSNANLIDPQGRKMPLIDPSVKGQLVHEII